MREWISWCCKFFTSFKYNLLSKFTWFLKYLNKKTVIGMFLSPLPFQHNTRRWLPTFRSTHTTSWWLWRSQPLTESWQPPPTPSWRSPGWWYGSIFTLGKKSGRSRPGRDLANSAGADSPELPGRHPVSHHSGGVHQSVIPTKPPVPGYHLRPLLLKNFQEIAQGFHDVVGCPLPNYCSYMM